VARVGPLREVALQLGGLDADVERLAGAGPFDRALLLAHVEQREVAGADHGVLCIAAPLVMHLGRAGDAHAEQDVGHAEVVETATRADAVLLEPEAGPSRRLAGPQHLGEVDRLLAAVGGERDAFGLHGISE
jgi:hypothetical protein